MLCIVYKFQLKLFKFNSRGKRILKQECKLDTFDSKYENPSAAEQLEFTSTSAVLVCTKTFAVISILIFWKNFRIPEIEILLLRFAMKSFRDDL
jgi:hypothetical protein